MTKFFPGCNIQHIYSARGDAQHEQWGGRCGRTARELKQRVEERLARTSGEQVNALEHHYKRLQRV